jgi:cytochrome c peroxidase
MRLINLRFRPEPAFFFDSRARSLEDVVTQPIRNPIELGFSGTNGDPDFAALIVKLSALPEYQLLFNIAFGSPGIDESRIQKALSQFVRSIQSFDSKFDAGSKPSPGGAFQNFTDSEKRGQALFLNTDTSSSRGANCFLCHSPSAFSNSNAIGFQNNGVITAIGGGTDRTVVNSPTLREMFNPSGQLNGPLMHDGSFTSIAQVLEHYNAPPDNPTLSAQLKRNGVPIILNLTQQDRVDLEAFLRTLSGTAVYTDPKYSDPFRPDGTITVIDTTPPPSQTVNLSTRLKVLTADKVGIGGFIIAGTAPKRVLIRALGPSLAKFGLSNLLTDPTITLQGPAGFSPITNDNWRSTQEAAIRATTLAPGDDHESAILVTLEPGIYTAILSGVNDGTGTGILEIYDLDLAADSRLANISTRGFVGNGDESLIAGFAVGNADSVDHVVIRGLGPSLQRFGIFPPVRDTVLEVRNANGATLATNDNWQQDPQRSDVIAAGLAPSDGLEAAIAITLGPGTYTALLSAKIESFIDLRGVGLVEIYSLGRVP